MKKFNRIMILVPLLFLLVSGTISIVLLKNMNRRIQYQLVEINKIQTSLHSAEEVEQFDLSSYRTILSISFIPWDEVTEKTLKENSKNGASFRLLTDESGKTLGVVRYEYPRQQSLTGLYIAIGIILFCTFLLIIFILVYLKKQVLNPFNRLSNVSMQLSKGHLNEELPETKSRYFGQFIWGIGMLRDKLKHENKKGLELEREKKLLLLSISHDLKTPLKSIKLYLKALNEGIYTREEQRAEVYGQIAHNAGKIENFVNEVIKSSSEDILSIEVNIHDFYLKDLVTMVSNTYTPKMAVTKTDFIIGAYDNRLIRGDIDRTMEVCENILENAIKYGDGRGIYITFREEDYCQLIEIRNTGIPLPQSEENHIFDSFYRGTNTAGKQGNGLGLYICRQIMQKMGGEIFSQRQENGMMFTLVFSPCE